MAQIPTIKVRVTRVMSERPEPLQGIKADGQPMCQSTVGNWQFRRQCKKVGRYVDGDGYLFCASHRPAEYEAQKAGAL